MCAVLFVCCFRQRHQRIGYTVTSLNYANLKFVSREADCVDVRVKSKQMNIYTR